MHDALRHVRTRPLSTDLPRAFAVSGLVFALACALASGLAASAAYADVPPLLIPGGQGDSSHVDPPAAPLIVPGRATVGAQAKTPHERAMDAYTLGRALERQGQPASAIASYRRAIMADSTLRDAHLHMGRLFARVGQHRAAANEFAAEVVLDPANTEAGRGLGISLSALGDSARAITQLELLTRRDPRDEASWQALGFAYATAHRSADAEKALKRALQLDPKDADAWRDLGALYANTGRVHDARAAYLKTTALDPNDALVLVNLGNLERREGNLDLALASYHQAERRDSLNAFAYRGQVEVFEQQQRDADAGAVYRRWLRAVPKEQQARIEAIALFSRLGRNDIALELGRDGVRTDARSGEAHLALGMAYHGAQQDRDALPELRLAQGFMRAPEQRKRIEQLIAGLRMAAPDSLRVLFSADSVAHMRPQGVTPPPLPQAVIDSLNARAQRAKPR